MLNRYLIEGIEGVGYKVAVVKPWAGAVHCLVSVSRGKQLYLQNFEC